MKAPGAGGPRDWSWLEDTYWYVRDPWLPAMRLDVSDNQLGWQIDQTVWHITGYRYGYFWGALGVQIYPAGEAVPSQGDGSRPLLMSMLGTVLPEGRVQIAFTGTGPASGQSGGPTIGSGRMAEYEGQPSFEMQMVSGTDQLTAHWAHMLQTRAGESSWESLPGVGVSVPEFLAGAKPPAAPAGSG